MRLLLDECVPKRLKRELRGHDAKTVQDMGWAGIKNGALLRLAEGHFDARLTVDQGIEQCPDLQLRPAPRRVAREARHSILIWVGHANARHRPSAQCVPESGPGVLTILKLHGSLNWRIDESDGEVYVLGRYEDVLEEGMSVRHEEMLVPHVVPPTWDKTVTRSTRYVWSRAVEALKQATRVIIVGFSFRVIDAHFKYLLAAGLMENSTLRRIDVINPKASKLARQIRSVIRRDQFVYGVVRLHDQRLHQFAMEPDQLKKIGRLPQGNALSIVELDKVRLMISSDGVVVENVG